MSYTVRLERVAQRRTDPATVRKQIDGIVGRGLAGGRKKRWKLAKSLPVTILPSQVAEEWQYELEIEFEFVGRQTTDEQKGVSFQQVANAMQKASSNRGKWSILWDEISPQEKVAPVRREITLATINIDKGRHFNGLYGLDSHIEIILDTLTAARDSGYKKRYHTVLWGMPGCGKTQLLNGIKQMLGPDGYFEFDGTATTAAGAMSLLGEAEFIPPVLIIEELEKTQDMQFNWLLSALDGRGRISKLNARVSIDRPVPFICLATVNDYEKFLLRQEGAVASRFAHSLHCKRPDEKTLYRILEREVKSIGGNTAWIEPAIRFCLDKEGNKDPRRAIAVCMTGKDKLLTGEFQDNVRACWPTAE